jgi:hypothetical protein
MRLAPRPPVRIAVGSADFSLLWPDSGGFKPPHQEVTVPAAPNPADPAERSAYRTATRRGPPRSRDKPRSEPQLCVPSNTSNSDRANSRDACRHRARWRSFAGASLHRPCLGEIDRERVVSRHGLGGQYASRLSPTISQAQIPPPAPGPMSGHVVATPATCSLSGRSSERIR